MDVQCWGRFWKGSSVPDVIGSVPAASKESVMVMGVGVRQVNGHGLADLGG